MSDTPAGAPGLADIASVGKALWWMVLIRGILAIAFGILALVFPDATLLALAILFAAYSIVEGVANIVHAIRGRARLRAWGWLLAQGIISVLAGIAVALFPVLGAFVGALFVIYMIAFWSIFTGVAGIPAAGAMADGGRKVWAYIAAVLSILFGIALVIIATFSPAAAISALVLVIGIYAIVFGAMLIVVAIMARSAANKVVAAA